MIPIKYYGTMSKERLHPMSIEGYKTLFDTLYPPLCLFANRYLNDMEMSKDIVQEVFIAIWKKNQSLKITDVTKAYFYTSVKNHCLNYLKSKHYRTLLNVTKFDIGKLETEEYFQSEMVIVETYAQLYKAIDRLPKKTAKVIQLALNQYSTNEIAKELSITTSTVRTQKSIGYQKLRILLNNLKQLYLNF